MLARGAVGPTSEIVRLDADKIDRLNLKKKEYTEVTFEELRTQLQKAMDRSKQNLQTSPKPMDDSKCEWLDPKVDVKRSGEKATYAGYDAERLTITASQPCKDKETGAICEVALSVDEWLAPKFTSAEADKFHRAYAQKMGLDTAYGQDISQRAQALFGQYKGIWTQIASKTRDAKGYPVRMSFAFAFGGEQCKGSPSAPQQSNGDDSPSGANNTPGGLAGQIGGKLGSLFHRKKDDSQPPAATDSTAPAATLPGGLVPLITMSSELVSVSTDSASPALFEVPADFKKIEPKTE
jgi:hypothetical protein